MIRNKIVLFVFSLFVMSFISCDRGNPAPPVLTKNMKKRIDTLFRNSVDSLNQLAEKRCDAQYDSLYKIAVDSMHLQRLREINEIVD